jgi:formyltetrahydrofolate synthetase
VDNLRSFGLPVVVAVNHFGSDTEAEHVLLRDLCRERLSVEAITCRHWADGAAGAEALAHRVAALCDEGSASLRLLYPDDMPVADKIRTIATRIYGAADIALDPRAASRLQSFEAGGHGRLPVCMAKTQYSFTTDPTRLGAPVRPRGDGARRAPLRRRGLRRGDLRGHHDYARACAGSGGGGIGLDAEGGWRGVLSRLRERLTPA